MLKAAKALIYLKNIDITDDKDQIIKEFQERLVTPRIFWDEFTGGKYADIPRRYGQPINADRQTPKLCTVA